MHLLQSDVRSTAIVSSVSCLVGAAGLFSGYSDWFGFNKRCQNYSSTFAKTVLTVMMNIKVSFSSLSSMLNPVCGIRLS